MIHSDTASTAAAERRALLEKYLKTNVKPVQAAKPSIPPRNSGNKVQPSFAQEQVWLHAQMAPDLPLYNEPVTIHYRGPFNHAAFERAFNEILRRHEAWRTAFENHEGQPFQIVYPDVHVSLPIVDLRHLPAERRHAEAIRLATADAVVPIDLTKAPLLRAQLMRLDDEYHRLYLTLSHIIFDGVAIYRVFLPELETLYRSFSQGMPSPLCELPFQYPDFAEWQRTSPEHHKKIETDLAYWRKQLSGALPTIDLPADHARPAIQTYRGSMYPWVLDAELMSQLKRLSQNEGVTLFQTMLAAFAVLLQRYSGHDDIPIGTVTSGRDLPGTTSLLGYFLNTLALRLDLSGGITFRQLLGRARNAIIEALAHDSVPFPMLVGELHVPRDSSRNPIFQSFFTLEPPMPDVESAWQLTQMDVDTGATKYDLYLELDERRDGILARYHYSTDLFDLPTIRRMAEEWTTLLRSAVSDPDKRLRELNVLPDSERRQILTEWNATEAPRPQTTVHELFEQQVERTPESIAVEFEGTAITYRMLNERANRLARHLQSVGVCPDTRVALCVERSAEMVIGLLGILKAGGAYVPIDPLYPADRLAFVIEDAQPRVILTQSSLREKFSSHDNVLLLDAELPDAGVENDSSRTLVRPEHLAYVIYTSGSTGQPKGVQVEHRNVVNFLLSMQRDPGITGKDVLVAVTTISFDIAGLEIYLPLISGARVVLATAATARDGQALKSLLQRSGATVMQATPTTWRLLFETGWKGSKALKALCGGEPVPADLANQLARSCDGMWNLYGPTETTIWSTAHRFTPAAKRVLIGRPIANTQIYVLDDQLQPAPVGVAGEVYIGGSGVARGYLNRPDLNAQRFLPNPFSNSPQSRIYRTGDLARYRVDGTLEFLGRNDAQVKIRGFRVELGEIECAVAKHAKVRSCVAVLREMAPADTRLIAYIVPKEGGAPDTDELRQHIRTLLPEYMMPAHFVFLTEIPLTPNGKVDRKSLPAPEAVAGQGRRITSPRNEVESQLVVMWQEILGVTPIGIHDDFFSLGGHSILAVRLFARIEKHFGKAIPLATLLKAPTVAQLAAQISQEDKAPEWISLVPFRRAGTQYPLFCVHGHFGEILFYRPLAKHLGEQQPFYALQAAAVNRNRTAHGSIEEMAEHYISEMKQAQPDGPYAIAGYCFGSLVAFEMAQRLTRAGETVAFLGLFIGYERPDPFAVDFVKRLRLHVRQLRQIGFRPKIRDFFTNVQGKANSLFWRTMFPVCKRVVSPTSAFFRNVTEMNLQAAKNYVPQFYPGRMTVFLSGTLPPDFVLDPQKDLHGMLASEVDLRVVPGERYTMMQEPHVSTLAEEVRACLRSVARVHD